MHCTATPSQSARQARETLIVRFAGMRQEQETPRRSRRGAGGKDVSGHKDVPPGTPTNPRPSRPDTPIRAAGASAFPVPPSRKAVASDACNATGHGLSRACRMPRAPHVDHNPR
ncbi:hypothetical protein GCM10023307_13100 [Lysobacter hankyongensis]|uniref:Uncharacterized protein n=1 Tax=Lysobacter hankyongensis TaxID=1176535 RepID=A0ABP9B458_9GAMM